MKKLLLTFGALMAFNAMINAQAPRPDRAGGPAAAPQGTETKSDDAAGRGAKPGATKPAATTPTTKPTSNPDGTTQGTDVKSKDAPGKTTRTKPSTASSTPKRGTPPSPKPAAGASDVKRRPNTTPEGAPFKGTDPVK
ncbi:MAG: hypothetical protein WAT21_01685 [Saprospiraceae bacterium]